MNKDQFKNLQAKLESIWNEDSFIVNDAPGQEAPAEPRVMVARDASKLPPDRQRRNRLRISQDLERLRAEKVKEEAIDEATQGPGVDAVMELIDMGVSKEDLFDQMMRDHSDDELLSFADDYRRMNDIQD